MMHFSPKKTELCRRRFNDRATFEKFPFAVRKSPRSVSTPRRWHHHCDDLATAAGAVPAAEEGPARHAVSCHSQTKILPEPPLPWPANAGPHLLGIIKRRAALCLLTSSRAQR